MSIFKFDLPPYEYLMQVVKHYPLAAATYIELWRKKDKKHRYSVTKNQIRNEFLISPAKFRNDLFAIAQEGLLNVDESWDKDQKEWWKLSVELVNFEEDEGN